MKKRCCPHPTPYIPHPIFRVPGQAGGSSREPGPMPRHYATVESPQNKASLREGWGGGSFKRCELQTFIVDTWLAHFLPSTPTSCVFDKQPSCAPTTATAQINLKRGEPIK